MINISTLPEFETLVQGLRTIKVRLPEKEKSLNEELKYLRVKNGKYIDCEMVKDNDIVKMNVSSSLERFNGDNIEVLVGAGFYHESFEKAILGMEKNINKTIEIDNEKIEVVILEIKEKVYGELSLESIQEENPEVKSLEEFKENIYDNICEDLIKEKANNLLIFPLLRKLTAQTEISCELKDIEEEYKSNAYKRIGGFEKEGSYTLVKCILKEDKKNAITPENVDRNEYIKSLSEDETKKLYDEYILNKFKSDSLCIKFGEMVGIDFSERAYEKEVDAIIEKYNYEKEFIIANYPYYAFKYSKAEPKVTEYLLQYFKKNNIQVIK